jgi:hypothetical protein
VLGVDGRKKPSTADLPPKSRGACRATADQQHCENLPVSGTGLPGTGTERRESDEQGATTMRATAAWRYPTADRSAEEIGDVIPRWLRSTDRVWAAIVNCDS